MNLLKVITVKKCIVYHYWLFNHGFKFQNYVCNVCHDLQILCFSIIDISIILAQEVDYRCIDHGVSTSKEVHLLESFVLDDRIYKMYPKEINIKNRFYSYYFDNLIKRKKLETKIILIREKNYKDSLIYF